MRKLKQSLGIRSFLCICVFVGVRVMEAQLSGGVHYLTYKNCNLKLQFS